VSDVTAFESHLLSALRARSDDLMSTITTGGKLSKETQATIETAITQAKETFGERNGGTATEAKKAA